MTQSITRQAITHVSKSIAPRMKDAGFRRQANHFHRQAGELVHGVNFQASRWGTSSDGSFTINLAVTSEWLCRVWSGREFPANPATALFPIYQRIGALLPDRRDLWWEVTSATDFAALVADVETAITRYAFHFFDTFSSVSGLLVHVRSDVGLPGLTLPQVRLVHAIIAVQAGLRAEAEAELERAARDAGDRPFAGTVRVIARRLGLSAT